MTISTLTSTNSQEDDGDGFFAKCRVLWLPDDPGRIRFCVAASGFADIDGAKPGMVLVWSSNPKSADYNPRYFNRGSRYLAAKGLPHPNEVPERSRRLSARLKEILGD